MRLHGDSMSIFCACATIKTIFFFYCRIFLLNRKNLTSFCRHPKFMQAITIPLSELSHESKTYLFLLCAQENITPKQGIEMVLKQLAEKYLSEEKP
jgi:hypothetical protein